MPGKNIFGSASGSLEIMFKIKTLLNWTQSWKFWNLNARTIYDAEIFGILVFEMCEATKSGTW